MSIGIYILDHYPRLCSKPCIRLSVKKDDSMLVLWSKDGGCLMAVEKAVGVPIIEALGKVVLLILHSISNCAIISVRQSLLFFLFQCFHSRQVVCFGLRHVEIM